MSYFYKKENGYWTLYGYGNFQIEWPENNITENQIRYLRDKLAELEQIIFDKSAKIEELEKDLDLLSPRVYNPDDYDGEWDPDNYGYDYHEE